MRCGCKGLPSPGFVNGQLDTNSGIRTKHQLPKPASFFFSPPRLPDPLGSSSTAVAPFLLLLAAPSLLKAPFSRWRPSPPSSSQRHSSSRRHVCANFDPCISSALASLTFDIGSIPHGFPSPPPQFRCTGRLRGWRTEHLGGTGLAGGALGWPADDICGGPKVDTFLPWPLHPLQCSCILPAKVDDCDCNWSPKHVGATPWKVPAVGMIAGVNFTHRAAAGDLVAISFVSETLMADNTGNYIPNQGASGSPV